MDRKYTVEEFREMASVVSEDAYVNYDGGAAYSLSSKFDENIISDMLRQAADAMDKLPSLIESRLGRAEKRQKDDLANALQSCLTWSQPITGKPEVCFADLEKLGRLWERLRKDADSIESEWEEVKS